jgi:ankyrin repeat protein
LPRQTNREFSVRRQLGRMIELQILVAAVGIAIAVFIPQFAEGKGVFMSLLIAVGWVAAIIGGLMGLAFLGMLPEMIRDWRTTPAAVWAARKKNALEALRKIQPERLDARAADLLGNTALHAALDCYEEERVRAAPGVVEFLLRQGADANAANTYDKTPLDLAVERGHGVEVVRRLLAAGAQPREVLHRAVGRSAGGSIEVVKALLDAGAPVNDRDVLGSTPLHAAAKHGTVEIVRELLARGADVGAADNVGQTPLHDALWMPSLAEQRTAGVVAMLLAAGADREAKNHQGQTPRALAQKSGVAAVIDAMNGTGG